MPQNKNLLPKSRLRCMSSLISRSECNAAQCLDFLYTAQSIVVFIRPAGSLRHFGFPPTHPEVGASGGQEELWEERKLSQTVWFHSSRATINKFNCYWSTCIDLCRYVHCAGPISRRYPLPKIFIGSCTCADRHQIEAGGGLTRTKLKIPKQMTACSKLSVQYCWKLRHITSPWLLSEAGVLFGL